MHRHCRESDFYRALMFQNIDETENYNARGILKDTLSSRLTTASNYELINGQK